MVNYRLTESVPESVEVLDQSSPVVLMKAVKTPAEMEHMRAAHIKDGVAVTRFIHWLKSNADGGNITELGAVRETRRLPCTDGRISGAELFTDHCLWTAWRHCTLCGNGADRCADEGGKDSAWRTPAGITVRELRILPVQLRWEP